MAIPEKQLDTWSAQGAVARSKNTYATVKAALEDANAPYKSKSYSVFLQGSYCNDTNIFSDSDVDVVMMLDDIYYSDLEHLSDEDKGAYLGARSTASYTWAQFKKEVVQQLTAKFGTNVSPGKKAIFVPASGNRRDCDVLACAELRRYTKFKSFADQQISVTTPASVSGFRTVRRSSTFPSSIPRTVLRSTRILLVGSSQPSEL
jgi:hypothetical protein